MALTPEQEREFIDDLERLGVTQVRSDVDHGRVSPALVHTAVKWLSGKERETEERREASNSAQIDLMRRAADAAEVQALEARRANINAKRALRIAIISIIVSAIGSAVSIGLPYWSAHK